MRTNILKTVAVAAIFTASAFAQDTAYVPFRVNVDAKITAKQDAKTVEKSVTGKTSGADTLKLPIAGSSSILYRNGARGQSNVPAVISNSRGNIVLRLPEQSYENAEITLYTVNGKRVLRGKADASKTASGITRRNVSAGVYMLSVKGINGNAFTTRLTHDGGNININAAFGVENIPQDKQSAKSAADGDWAITVSATTPNKYRDSSYILTNVVKGVYATRQNITLVDTSTSVQPPVTSCTPTARTFNNVTYDTRGNRMNITLPSSGNGPWPLIMFVHGGAWQGTKGSPGAVSAPFGQATSKGYALASISYSYIGSGKAFPESVEDVLTAIRFLRAKAADYCINPDKIGITGFSSGGYFTHITAALSGASNHGFDKDALNVAGVPAGVSSKVQAAASCSGLSDFLLLNTHVQESGGSGMNHCGTGSPNGSYFGFDPCTATGANKDIVDRSNPIKYITAANCANIPPLLSMHGTADNIVPWKQSELMVNTINSVCGAGRAELYKHTGGHNCPSGQDNMIWNFLDAALK